MNSQNVARLKWACYITNISMSVVSNFAPILFLGFRELYGISYSMLGLLVLVNFSTQLAVDLFLSFFSHLVNKDLLVRLTPVLTMLGLVSFAAAPMLFADNVFLGLVIGTVIYSASGGLGEVLISPVIAALPSDNPEREVSILHSVYAWGVVGVVPLATIFIHFFGEELWQILSLGFAAIPLVASLLFIGTTMPKLDAPERVKGVLEHFKNPTVWVMIFAIFLGGASEVTMAQWSSSFLEGALGIDKIWGDIFGVALFAAMLGLGRSMFGKYGTRAEPVLLFGAIGAFVCYIVAALSPFKILGLLAVALTGLAVSMLWPGSIIIGSERVPTGGVFIYALMAAGGDLGASVGPQLVGIVTDAVSANPELATLFGMPLEELGMKIGILVGAIFPLIAIFVYLYLFKTLKPRAEQLEEIKSQN